MPVFPCPNKVDCAGTDLPLINFSSEQKDAPTFIGLSWGQQGLGICESVTSQEDADLCAARDACIVNTSPRYFNSSQGATVYCPTNGAPFTFTVPAGLFCAGTQAAADAQAQSYAMAQAQARMFCLICPANANNGSIKVLNSYTGSFSVTGASTSAQYTIIAGALPPGLSMDVNGKITGIALLNGNFSTTVQAINTNGDFMVGTCYWTIGAEVPVCQPIDCGAGLCWNQQQCACVGYGNDAQSGSLTCPCNALITVSGTIAKCTYQSTNPADYPTNLNNQAQTALAALLLQGLASAGCGTVKISGSTIDNTGGACDLTVGVYNPGGTFADPTFHNFTVPAGSSADWCVFIFGLTGDHHAGSHYFGIGSTASWFSC